eukprot:Skav217630  [mRNA]  locus=scaffold2613:103541:107013:+ [translate_table: standard]
MRCFFSSLRPRRPLHWHLWHWFRVWARCLQLALRAMPLLTLAILTETFGPTWENSLQLVPLMHLESFS